MQTKLDSKEALALFASASEKFDLVITDMTMPHMTREKLARKLMEVRPDIPIILCTGYNDRISEQKVKEMGIRAFIMKPIACRCWRTPFERCWMRQEDKTAE